MRWLEHERTSFGMTKVLRSDFLVPKVRFAISLRQHFTIFSPWSNQCVLCFMNKYALFSKESFKIQRNDRQIVFVFDSKDFKGIILLMRWSFSGASPHPKLAPTQIKAGNNSNGNFLFDLVVMVCIPTSAINHSSQLSYHPHSLPWLVNHFVSIFPLNWWSCFTYLRQYDTEMSVPS